MALHAPNTAVGATAVPRTDLLSPSPRRTTVYKASIAAVLIALATAPSASADIGVSLDRWSARTGERVRATSGPFYLSLYLTPARSVPPLQKCNNGAAICQPTSLGPPRRAGWVWLGRFFPERPSFHFRVPTVAAGAYRAVVYCPPCVRGPRGSLIASERVFRVVAA
jgi:hypothetical protein